MLRLPLGPVLALALSGCWFSEQRLFGSADWTAPDIAGAYISENADGDAEARVVLSVRPDRAIEGVAQKYDEDSAETSTFGFVAIAGGDGRHFIMVDRSDGTDDMDLYLIAHLTDDGAIEVYLPQCSGTPEIAGMTRENDPWIKEDVCMFTSKAAVMRAALEAERALSAPRIFEIRRLGRLVPDRHPEPFEP